MNTERILDGNGRHIATILRNVFAAGEGVHFATDAEENLQLGTINHPAGHVIPSHVHLEVPRTIVGTSEALLVLQGSMEVTLYADGIESQIHDLHSGDAVLLIAGGHGFRVGPRGVLAVEVKQGPFLGTGSDKEPIHASV